MQLGDLHSDQLQLRLLPPRILCTACKEKCIFSIEDYGPRLAEIRRFRGEIFLADGGITHQQLNENGGYQTTLDDEAWHVYLSARGTGVCACCTFMLHRKGVAIEELRVHKLLERIEAGRRGLYQSAIESIIEQSAARNLGFGEAAAWAVHDRIRNRCASLTMAVAGWPLYQMLGGALVLGAPTLRHHTASIEKRIGGFPLSLNGVPLRSFYDSGHGCEMEFVWFDSARPSARFGRLITELRAHFQKLRTCRCSREINERELIHL